MSRKRTDRLRRFLTVEALEDRTVLSGNLTVFMLPFPALAGHVIILDDFASNHYSINASGGTLTVMGTPLDTAVNGGLSASFPLASVNEIDINNPAFFGNPNLVLGNNTIEIGNTGGFTIPNNIVMDFGPGHDVVTMNHIGDNITQFNGTFGGGMGSDTVTTSNSVQGASILNPGSGTNVMSYTGDTIGVIQVATPVTSHEQKLQVLNSNNGPPPRSAAIGALIARLSPGPSTSSNEIVIAGDTIGLAQIQSGDHSAGNKVSNTVTIANDTITGAGMFLDMFNGSGQNNGAADASVNNFTSTQVNFTTGGTYQVVADDGPSYVATDGSVGIASMYSQTLTDGAGAVVIQL